MTWVLISIASFLRKSRDFLILKLTWLFLVVSAQLVILSNVDCFSPASDIE